MNRPQNVFMSYLGVVKLNAGAIFSTKYLFVARHTDSSEPTNQQVGSFVMQERQNCQMNQAGG
jgi:hypothetical protein